MNNAQLVKDLRLLADRLESDDQLPEAKVDVWFHGIVDRPSLAAAVKLMRDPECDSSGSYHWVSGPFIGESRLFVHALYKGGLLDKLITRRMIEVVEEDSPDLQSLMAEYA